ncbi:DEAD/DEAH box helicase [Myceligenerans crystallogenes]|uniref:DEAD/DEAH box helicase n=1 Tax=Myceligenerans crystallogenes TaxID=316335 RepID=A0ABN2NNC6_9MICO
MGSSVSAREARQVVEEAAARLGDARLLMESDAPYREAVRDAYAAVRRVRLHAELVSVRVEELETRRKKLRVAVLRKKGFRDVAQVLDAGIDGLVAAGIGETTARPAVAAARELADEVEGDQRFRIDVDPADPHVTALVRALRTFGAVTDARHRHYDDARRLAAVLPPYLGPAGALTRWWRRLFADHRSKAAALAAIGSLRGALAASSPELATAARTVRDAVGQRAGDPWADFERRSAEYYGLLSQVVDLGDDHEAAEGFLPADVVRRVEAQPLDRSLLHANLRAYQSFGAKYALVQRRTILGDEMGLGKTMQSLAVMTHLAAAHAAAGDGPAHFLVVCPASVVTNWAREVTTHSALPAVVMHGNDRDDAAAAWAASGGVGVTTFEMLGRLDLPADLRPALMVVDEAHYVKNPETLRGQSVRSWTDRADRVLFLSGTPMENKVAEFKAMVGYLQPVIAKQLDPNADLSGAQAFRRIVAPVYLRRNTEDVLTELPDLVQVEEWEEFGRADGAAYARSVAAGNFMAMRRAAFDVERPEDSAKLVRLKALVDEAVANGRRVIVFSYFIDVLDQVMAVLGDVAVGPLTGRVKIAERQEMVDSLSQETGPRVLVSQITAGGVGLNVQAASVVIFCEPQVKPTIEAQAVARAHRMGQTRTVQVHRLLVADSVDQRMMEILDTKAALFEQFARQSEITETSELAIAVGDRPEGASGSGGSVAGPTTAPGAPSEAELGRAIVAAERERLAGGPGAVGRNAPEPVPAR